MNGSAIERKLHCGQYDHLSGKPGNVREASGKNLVGGGGLFIANSTFGTIKLMIRRVGGLVSPAFGILLLITCG